MDLTLPLTLLPLPPRHLSQPPTTKALPRLEPMVGTSHFIFSLNFTYNMSSRPSPARAEPPFPAVAPHSHSPFSARPAEFFIFACYFFAPHFYFSRDNSLCKYSVT
ncbi:hypothetical protein BDZ91DRAFT_412100 [Kalaharituber pfeilii]|nr:hypothetical protein BDZ91DRAFT_412100 [Kalaharituber pfeilii]